MTKVLNRLEKKRSKQAGKITSKTNRQNKTGLGK
jgi:hypothetical protein